MGGDGAVTDTAGIAVSGGPGHLIIVGSGSNTTVTLDAGVSGIGDSGYVEITQLSRRCPRCDARYEQFRLLIRY